MPNLKDIRKRITSVRNTQQITKAMKMVSAAKLRRAQEAILAARPYAEKIEEVLSDVATREDDEAHPLLQRRTPRRVELVVMTSDRGLAGGFNANITRLAQRFLYENRDAYERIQISTIGRKGRDWARSRKVQSRKDYVGVFEELVYEKARTISLELQEAYLGDQLDAAYLLYNRFQSAIAQKPMMVQLLPVFTNSKHEDAKGKGGEFLYEPSRRDVLDVLVPQHLSMQIWRSLLESVASEHAARMTSMENATKNASELISSLRLQYNRARQASITKELMEIVSGAEALK